LFTVRRKEAYEELHPETRHGGSPGASGGGKVARDPKIGSFTKDTATKTGRSRSSVAADATRGKRIDGAVLRLIAGTDLDNGRDMDELARATKDKQSDKVREIKQRKAEKTPSPVTAVRESGHSAIMTLPPNEVAARETLRALTFAGIKDCAQDPDARALFLGLPLTKADTIDGLCWVSPLIPEELLAFLGIKDVVSRYKVDESTAAANERQARRSRKRGSQVADGNVEVIH
jgi:hypothetical protein